MTKFAIVAVIGMCLLVPTIASADSYLYTLSTDYSGINGNPAGSTVSWQFEVPSLLTSTTTITSFISASLGPGLSGCGGVLDAQLPFPAPSPYTSYWITDFTGTCNGGINGAVALSFGDLNPGIHNAFQFSTGMKVGTLTIAPVPEPTTMSLLTTGLIGIVAAGLRRRASKTVQDSENPSDKIPPA